VATPPHTATEHEIRERTATDERQATTFPKVIISAAVEQPRGRWEGPGGGIAPLQAGGD